MAELQAIDESDIDHVIPIDDARLFLSLPSVPHKPVDGPGTSEICAMLGGQGLGRYAARPTA